MRRKNAVLIFLMTAFTIAGIGATGMAATLSLQPTSDGDTSKTTFLRGEDLYLNIVVDDHTGIAGAAFTLNYPTDVLTAPTTSSEGVSGDITSIFPFSFTNPSDQVTSTTHRENSSTPGKILFSGAAIDTSTGGAKYTSASDNVLFTVKFGVKADATYEGFQLSLEQTQLFNTAAGWGVDNDQDGIYDQADDDQYGAVPVLVGAVPNSHGDWDNLANGAFPLITANFSSPLDLYVSDGDSIDDAWENTKFGNVTDADDTTDWDHDGYRDKDEYALGWEPKTDNNPYLNEYYDETLDENGPYQVATTNSNFYPGVIYAAPGGPFAVNVRYKTSDGVNLLSGLDISIHFDSTKVDYNNFENFLAVGDSTLEPTLLDDTNDEDGDTTTDKRVNLSWSSSTNQWPNVSLPALLAKLNFTLKSGVTEISNLNVSSFDNASGYAFVGIGSTITPQEWNLDVDGNGEAKPLTDGLLLVRYLFRYHLAGAGWTQGFIGANATRDEAAIAAYLENGITSLAADIDGNGECKPLTDGLLAIRYLFRYNLAGAGWTQGFIGANSTRDESAVQDYLMVLMPPAP